VINADRADDGAVQAFEQWITAQAGTRHGRFELNRST
jgi:hypothetical protein